MNPLTAAGFLCFATAAQAQPPWQPSPGHTQLAIWPHAVPDARPMKGPETAKSTGSDEFVAGKPWLYVEHVAQPTMTVYSPHGKNTGAAIVVFPGGGYEILAIDLGDRDLRLAGARRSHLRALKYRVPAPRSAPDWGAYPQSPMALEDAQRTISLVRSRAVEWCLDPHKIGVLGFSAGGHLAIAMSVHFDQRLYAPVDAADQTSCRPDFAVALYPGHLSEKDGTLLNPDIVRRITAQTPPTFLLQNENDKVDTVWDAISYYAALVKANVSVEFHSYAEGGHGFGLRKTKYPATAWPKLVETWLHTIGILAE